MTRHYKTFLILFLPFLFLGGACTSTRTAETQDAPPPEVDSFVQLANDPAFREAHLAPQALDTSTLKGSLISLAASGPVQYTAYLSRGEVSTGDKVIIMLHEWWGLNDHIKAEADRWAAAFPSAEVFALDLYNGKVANTPEQAEKLMKSAKPDELRKIIAAALEHVGSDASIATIGWCFGGRYSMVAAIEAREQADACVLFYGMPVVEADQLQKLNCPVLGIFASQDEWINSGVVSNFQSSMSTAGKELMIEVYEADHAFANPSNPAFDSQATLEAYQRAFQFIGKHLILD